MEPSNQLLKRVTTSMRDEIVERLGNAILDGHFVPGERLNERQLAEMLGVSRPPLREAIRQLEAEGLVSSSPRRGSHVRRFSGEEIRELYSLRYAIEAAAAEYVATYSDPEAIDALESMLLSVEEASQQGVPETIHKDLLFHREIVVRSGSARLLQTWDQLLRELKLALKLIDPKLYLSTYVVETHKPLLLAIKQGDIAGIRVCTGALRQVGDSLSRHWEEFENLSLPVTSAQGD